MASPVDNSPIRVGDPSVQALIELIYIKTANDQLSEKMAELEDALTVTSTIMKTLSKLQLAHNELYVEGVGKFNFNYAQSAANYANNYSSAASAFFGAPIDPKFIYASSSASGYEKFASNLRGLAVNLANQIFVLSGMTPASGSDSASLLVNLHAVMDDLNSYPLYTYSGVSKWVLDNYNVHSSGLSSKAGSIQQNLTNAITAGESLNDTQKETVRRFLYLFEEYYKSASAILQKISQIIEKLAQGISK